MMILEPHPHAIGWSYTTAVSPADTLDVACLTETPTPKTRLLQELARQWAESSVVGWDGYGAAPVLPITHRNAHLLAESFADDLPMPTVGAESDGHLTMEWYRDVDHVLSLSVAPDGTIYYASLIGAAKRAGSSPFTGTLPHDVADLVKILYSL
jgi:hypothetical protein